MMRTILHVDMNSYFATVEQQADPSLRGKPIGVSGKPNARSIIASASIEAKRLGVKTAMSTREAKRVCPPLIFITADPQKYIAITGMLFDIFHQFTPSVEFFSVDEAFLDVTSSVHLFGGAVPLAKKIKKLIREKIGDYLTCSIGISYNKLLAKLGSDLNKPDGLVVIDENNLSSILSSVKLTDFCGIGERIEKHLQIMGINSVKRLADTPLGVLRQEFGLYGETLFNMARGIDNAPVVPSFATPLPKSYSHAFTLPKDTYNIAEIRAILYRLAEKCGRRMRNDRFTTQLVSLYFRYFDFTGFSKQKKLHRTITDGKEIYIESLALFPKRLEKSIRMVAIGVSDLIPVSHTSLHLFSEDARREKLLAAMDVINNRFGDFTIGRASYYEISSWEKTTAGIRTRLRFI